MPALLLLPLLVAVISCSDEEDGREIEDLVTIESPAGNTTYETYQQTLRVSGSRWSSVESVTWVNAAGGSGPAELTFQQNCVAFPLPIVFPQCNHAWNASVPLVIGANPITVTGFESDRDFGRDTITITRLACPPPPPATPFEKWPLACR